MRSRFLNWCALLMYPDVSWRSVPGGRVAHIFIVGEDIPVCGVSPLLKNGHPAKWKPYRRTYRNRVHAECWRRCPHRPRLNRPMSQEEIENE